MSSDDKKIKTNPAPKDEVPSKDKNTSGGDTSKAEGGKIADASPADGTHRRTKKGALRPAVWMR
jgi:hypothetical protein